MPFHLPKKWFAGSIVNRKAEQPIEHHSIAELYRKYGPAVLRRAQVLLRNQAAAEDMLQEVFLRVINNYQQFRGEASPMTWLYRITTNLCLNWLRDHVRRNEILAEHLQSQKTDETQSSESTVILLQLLERLPAQLKEIAVYTYIDNMNQDEIAGVIGTSRRTIGNRLDSLQKHLKKLSEQ